MSLKNGMATQEMQTQHPAALTAVAGSSTSNGSNFVKAIDRKARSYFKTLERSFSSSMAERGEDPSSMTIGFLRTQLQAQRADYKAEKQRAQQLAKKVLELEQKLSFEIKLRKEAECRDMLISPRHGSGSLNFPNCNERVDMTSEELMEEDLVIIRDNLDGATGCEDDCAFHLEGQKASIDSETTKMHVNTLHLKQDLAHKPSNKAYSIDTEALKETSKYNRAPSEIKGVPEPTHTFLCSQPHRQARIFWKHAGESSTESLEHLSLDHSKQYVARAMRDQSKQYFARAIHSHQDCHGRVPDSILNPVHKMVSGGVADSTSSSPSSQEHSQRGFYVRDGQSGFVNAGTLELEGRYSWQLSPSMSGAHDRIHGYRVAHYDHSKEMQEDRCLMKQMRNQEIEGMYMEAMQHPDSLRTGSSHGGFSHSENFLTSHENTISKHHPNFSSMHPRHDVKLQGHRMSLDGGLDRLRERLKALEMAKRQV